MKNNWKHIALSAFLLVLISCKAPMVFTKGDTTIYRGKITVAQIQDTQKNHGVIRGKLVDIRNNEIIPNARVEVKELQISIPTNDEGEFEMEATGEVTLNFIAVGHTTQEEKYTVHKGREIELLVEMGTSVIY